MAVTVARATITPPKSMPILSRLELGRLSASAKDPEQKALFRQCVLAVLNTGSECDDPAELFEEFRDFEVWTVEAARGILLELRNAPAVAFVDGILIEGIREHLYAVLRDIVYMTAEVKDFAPTSQVFQILRHANIFVQGEHARMVVCWGGHSISRPEYRYCKRVGYELGLRLLNVVTGCGPGAMKGPMKGAILGLAKQRSLPGRFIGITEPGIIAAESPNPIVNELVILPDIEKRLEAFVRLAHCLVVFPGGAGTAEELLYVLALKMNPKNRHCILPLVLTAGPEQAEYFQSLDAFIRATLGDEAAGYYEILIDQPEQVAERAIQGQNEAIERRREREDPYYYHSELLIDDELKEPFEPTHESMAALKLHRNQPRHELAIELRKLFSGIVAGNIKQPTVKLIQERGPFQIHAEPALTEHLDRLLRGFVEQGRMKIGGGYKPCYEVVAAP
ncbi:MAG: nucleotide 5'-monophosphate nucleosidase PpnN [Polyangiaceae bacterium]|nr:nucleotide 5'-monophosphate nucleosidase PpnN [Polyangiaceae bacterium]